MIRSTSFTLGMVLVIGLLGGCHNTRDLETFVADSDKNVVGHVKPIPKPVVYSPTTYVGVDANGQALAQDPFVVKLPQSTRADQAPNAPDPRRPKEFLESFGLDQLVMVGFLQGERGRAITALVRSPDHRLNLVNVGQYLGTNFGRVVEVSSDRIVLVETVQDQGVWIDRSAQLLLNNASSSN